METAAIRNPVYCEGFNDTGSTIVANKIVEGDRTDIILAAGVDSVPYGVTARDIPDQEMGDVQTDGWALVLAGTAGMTVGAWVMPEAGGTGNGVDLSGSTGDNKSVLGRCERAATSGNIGVVRIAISQIQIAD